MGWRILRHREHASRLDTVLKTLGGKTRQGDDLSLIENTQRYPTGSTVGTLDDILQTRRRKFIVARDRLLDATTTAFLLVVNPDKLSLLESQKVVTLLTRFKIAVSAVVVNRVLPDETDVQGDFFEARREQEQTYRREIDVAFSRFPRVVVPLLHHDVCGMESLDTIGQRVTNEWVGR